MARRNLELLLYISLEKMFEYDQRHFICDISLDSICMDINFNYLQRVERVVE